VDQFPGQRKERCGGFVGRRLLGFIRSLDQFLIDFDREAPLGFFRRGLPSLQNVRANRPIQAVVKLAAPLR